MSESEPTGLLRSICRFVSPAWKRVWYVNLYNGNRHGPHDTKASAVNSARLFAYGMEYKSLSWEWRRKDRATNTDN